MSDQQSLSLGEPGIVGPLSPRLRATVWGVIVRLSDPSLREKLIDVSRRLSKSALSL